MIGPKALEEMVRAYIHAALWSSIDDTNEDKEHDDTSFDSNGKDISDFAPEAMLRICIDCVSFAHTTCDLWGSAEPDQVGHDFWLTRNGHGAGFFDRGELYCGHKDTLSNIARNYREINVVTGDDGKLYME